MTEEAFVEWWKNLDSVSGFFFSPSTTLPGKVVELVTREELSTWRALECCGKFITAHIHTDGDSWITTTDEVTHHHKGYDSHYYDPKPGDTCCHMNKETGEMVMGKLDDNLEFVPNEQQNSCCKCPHHKECGQEGNDEIQVDVPNLPNDSGEGEGR
jgi:hypothetical protein